MGFELKCMLRQETVMIHFQHDTPGACLRGSEVKPKLDRFIREYYGKFHDGGEVPSKWYLDIQSDHKALDYKIRIKAVGNPKEIILPTDVYFGNMGENKNDKNWKKRKGIWCPDGMELTILCFTPELLKEIAFRLEGFFLMTNFGTRQSKGLGSFRVVELTDGAENTQKIAEGNGLLQVVKEYAKEPVYEIQIPPVNNNQKGQTKRINLYDNRISYRNFEKKEIKQYFFLKNIDAIAVHNLMKSGINRKDGKDRKDKDQYFKGFCIRYHLRQTPSIKSDKALIKGYIFHNKQINQKEYQFFRAFLGLVDHYEFKNTMKGKIYREDSRVEGGTIEVSHSEIKRFQSPITYKIFDNHILMYIEKVPEELFDQSFKFKLKNKNREIEIKTPEKFDIYKFVEEFARDFNCKTGIEGQNDLTNAQNAPNVLKKGSLKLINPDWNKGGSV